MPRSRSGLPGRHFAGAGAFGARFVMPFLRRVLESDVFARPFFVDFGRAGALRASFLRSCAARRAIARVA